MDKFWENMFVGLLFLTFATAVGLGIKSLTSEHQIQRYYLESYSLPNNGGHELRIISDREWWVDGEIVLDRNVTYNEAILLVEEMNQKLDR